MNAVYYIGDVNYYKYIYNSTKIIYNDVGINLTKNIFISRNLCEFVIVVRVENLFYYKF